MLLGQFGAIKLNSFNNIYKNKKVFLTGHTGFKGSWLNLWLKKLGAEVFGYSLKPNTNPSLHNILKADNGILGDILDTKTLEKSMIDFQPDIIFHLAAQPVVRLSYREPVNTYMTNVIGTLNVLEAARKCPSVKAFVNITTDKCYENKEIKRAYKEDDPMGGYDMYSSSKGCVEIMSASYRRSFLKNGFNLATARAGNVIGGGDWTVDRLLVDCIVAIQNNQTIQIRYPNSIRPWQFVLEPLAGYLRLGELLLTEGKRYAQGFNFGPNEAYSVIEVVEKTIQCYGKGKVIINKDNSLHEAGLLMLDNKKAKDVLNWKPQYNIDEAIHKTVEWYKSFYNSDDMEKISIKQIDEYEEKIK